MPSPPEIIIMFLLEILYSVSFMLAINFCIGIVLEPLAIFICKVDNIHIKETDIFWPLGIALPLFILIIYLSDLKESNKKLDNVISNLTLTGWSHLPYSIWVFCRLYQLARRARRRAPKQEVNGDIIFNPTPAQREHLAEMWRMGTPVEDEADGYERLEREHFPNLQGLFNPRGTIAYRAVEPIEYNRVRYW